MLGIPIKYFNAAIDLWYSSDSVYLSELSKLLCGGRVEGALGKYDNRLWLYFSGLVGIILFAISMVFPPYGSAANPGETIRIVYNRGIAPIKFTNDDGQASGIINEYWKLLGRKSGLTFQFIEVETFGESLEMVRRGEVDLHAGIFFTEERNTFLEYSTPILSLKYYIYSTTDMTTPTTLEDTRGMILGVVQGGFTENYIKKKVPSSRLMIYKDFGSMFEAVLSGELKVFVSSDIHLNYYLSRKNLDNPFRQSASSLYEQTYYGASAKRNNALVAKIKARQQLLTEDDRDRLKQQWLHYKVSDGIYPTLRNLSSEELSWLKEHPVVRVSNETDWPPFDFNVDGQPMGLSIDYLELLSDRLGVEFEYIYGYPWETLLEKTKQKEIDLIHSLNRSVAREEFISFGIPYISNQTVIVTNKENNSIKKASDLAGKRVAAIDGYNQKRLLEEEVDGVRFVPVESPLAALKAVSSGKADATLRFNGVANYLIQHHLLSNLKFVNEFKIEGDNLHELYLGVRKDWPLFQEIVRKGQESISREEMDKLKKKWISFNALELEQKRIAFTDEEKNWIKTHPEIILGSDYKWAPFDFLGETGEHSGLSSEYVRLIEERTGLNVTVRGGVWSDIIADMKKGNLDGLVCAVKTEERTEFLDFSSPYLSVPTAIIVQSDNGSITGLADLVGKSVALNKDSYMHEWMKKRYPRIKLHPTTSNEASIEAVSYGEADAYIGNLAVAMYIMRKGLLTNLKVVTRLDSMVTEPAIAIDKTQPVLMGIIQKVLDSVSTQEQATVLEKWYTASTEIKIELSPSEQRWLEQNRVVRVSGDPAWAPLSYIDAKGEYKGIIPDFFKLLGKKSGLEFDVVILEKWSDVLGAMKNKDIELIDAITENSDRRQFMDFTEVYMNADVVLVTRDDIKYIRGLDYIGKRRVGTVEDYITESYIRGDYPEMNLSLYPTAAQGLKGLAKGEIDIFVIDIPTFEYYTKKSSLINLKISGLTPYTFSLGIGVHKGQPELLAILNKSLELLSQREKNEIYNNWVTLKEPLVDYSLIWKVALAACCFLAVIIYWNRRLAHEVSLRKAAELSAVQASRAKSEFLANMSHEIRTPMNSVLGFAELLDHMITDPEQKSYLKSIRAGGKSLLGIINDILDLSKIEAGRMDLKSEPVSLEKLFKEMRDFFNDKMERKDLTFTYRVDPALPAYILLDGTRLRQVLVNLIGNGIKFTEQGSIDLTAADVRMTGGGKSVDFSIIVRDTGIGIPKEQQQAIFNKFEQQEGQDHLRYGGTGLGLSICKSLSQLMGGSISVLSEPGEGAAFTVRLVGVPVTETVLIKENLEQKNDTGFQEANVLVVDDVRDNRALLVGHFKQSKITFFEAENGEEALEILFRAAIDLVFLDLRMPVMNGYETITRIRQENELQNIPVVAVTASVMGQDLEKVHKYGFDDYLRKPVERQDLFQVAAEYLEYEEHKEREQVDIKLDLSLDNMAQWFEFANIIESGLLTEYHRIKDRGDFELIALFANRLLRQASEHGVEHFVEYAEQLSQHVESFDIAEVDSLMKRFPAMLQALKIRLTEEETSDAS